MSSATKPKPAFTYPNRLSRILADRGLTTMQAGSLTGLGQSYICLVKNGQRDPRMSTCQRIARGLGLTVADIWPIA